MTTSGLTEAEVATFESVRLWLESMEDMATLAAARVDPEPAAKCDVAPWVRRCVERLEGTLFAGPTHHLGELVITPFRVGYAMGIMQCAAEQHAKSAKGLAALKPMRRVRPVLRRKLHRLIENLYLRTGFSEFLEYHESKYIPRPFRRVSSHVGRLRGNELADYHEGLSKGLRGIGNGTPDDRSNDATDIYLLLLTFSRLISRLRSITELHRYLVRFLGGSRVGDRKRIEKICERIGLSFRQPGDLEKIRHHD